MVDIGGYSRECAGEPTSRPPARSGWSRSSQEMAIAAGDAPDRGGRRGRRPTAGGRTPSTRLGRVAQSARRGPREGVQKVEGAGAREAEIERKLKAFEQKASAGLAEELAAWALVARRRLKFVSAVGPGRDARSPARAGLAGDWKMGEGVVQAGRRLRRKGRSSPSARRAQSRTATRPGRS